MYMLQSPQVKKEEYRLYLEKTGISDAIAKVLVALYSEPLRPENPIEYVGKYFGAPRNVDIEQLQNENTALKEDNRELKRIIEQLAKANQELKDQLAEYE